MTVHITLFSGTADARRNALLFETLGRAILDSACTKSVAGCEWLQEFLATLSEDEMKLVEEKESNASYLFGDGVENKRWYKRSLDWIIYHLLPAKRTAGHCGII